MTTPSATSSNVTPAASDAATNPPLVARHRRPRAAALVVAAAGAAAVIPASPATADTPPLASFFGFDAKRIVVVDDDAGPAIVADFNNDGRNDLVVANDAKSRIELHLQRERPRTPEEMDRDFDVNELPPSTWFDRVDLPVSHQINAMLAHDVNGDGKLDIIYAGSPREIVVLEQRDADTFDIGARRRVRELSASPNSFAIADLQGDSGLELAVAVAGEIHVFPLDASGPVGEPRALTADDPINAFFVEDYDGDGRQDILGVIAESDAPLRLWLQQPTPGGDGAIGPETRFEMPALMEVEPLRTPGRDAASIAVIERQSRRIIFYDLAREQIEERRASDLGVAERDATVEVHAFRGGEDRDRSTTIADINADGLPDLIATDASTNSLVVHLQQPGVGLDDGSPFSAFKDPKTVAAGQWDADAALEVIVLSEEEKSVGVAHFNADTGRLGFPRPLDFVTAGADPVAMTTIPVMTAPGVDMHAVAVVMKDRRDHALEVHFPDELGRDAIVVELDDVNRAPGALTAGDFNRDGNPDLLLLTPGEPLVMVSDALQLNAEEVVLYDDDMANFGLVSAAAPNNTAILDVNDDGDDEFLIADENFVRAAAFTEDAGWTVVDQFTVPDPAADLEALASYRDPDLNPTVVAADTASSRLLFFRPDDDGAWTIADKLRLTGVEPDALAAGPFTGSAGQTAVLAITPDSFGIVQLRGARYTLDDFATYRSNDDDLREHEIETGDVNGDGFVDIVILENNDKLTQIFTLSAARSLLFATEFKVFEERLFNRGRSSRFEPSSAIIADITGDGAQDLILQVHDRYLIYPQTTND